MLLPEHVMAQRRGDKLVLRKLDDATRARALLMAREMVGIASSQQGAPRSDVETALESVDALPKDARVKTGLAKLVLDRCTFEAAPPLDPESLRRDLFTRAARGRREHGHIDRAALVADVAASLHVDPDTVERALYADLRAAHPLVSFDPITPLQLADELERCQAQAVLLRAEKVAARVKCSGAGALRELFRKLKFLRLLFTVAEDKDAFVIGIDGPMSLYDAGTKYGLSLALALPALEACDEVVLEALVRWGKERTPLVFRWEGGSQPSAQTTALPDEVEALRVAINSADSGWRAKRGQTILALPGVGVCVPDLTLEREKKKVHVEVLGYWSRDAVWKRVELAEKGLGARVVFCVSSRLRVSEEVLPDDAHAALYVYKGTLSAAKVIERANKLAQLP